MTGTRKRQADWEHRYHAGSTGWDRGDISPALDRWLSQGRIPAGRVLVPGCGHGYEVAALVRAGCSVTAVDIAAQPVVRLMGALTEQGLHAHIVQADLLHWQPAEPFDAIYEQTCLCAIDPADWSDYERRLADWLVPGGSLLALFMQTDRDGGPPFHCALPQMRELFSDDRWLWPESEPIEVDHPNGLHELGAILVRR